jgi:hypothetical protein
VGLDVKFVENFVVTIDFFSDEVEIEIAACAHQMGDKGLLKHVAFDCQNVVG